MDRHVGRRVQAKRVELGYSQGELGQALGLTFQQIQKYEKGANRIAASRLWAIAAVFKVEIGYFFEGLDTDGEGAPLDPPGRFPTTRATVEIAGLTRRLSLQRQKLVVDLMRDFLSRPAPGEDADLSDAAVPRTDAAETAAPPRQD
ncbi:helix-turn-helix domain-containing protein [Brevundimonas sp. GCM10030266]|uniref:helix-turn-helix domain-containing protein n=1 Tax=Brevundimonas sp. GCM10030266 TaxID=3273386 RepID=UPI00360E8188